MPKSSVKRSNHVWPNSSFSEDSSDSLPSVSEKWKSPARSSDSPWKHRKSSMQHSNILPPLTDGGFFAVFNKSPPLQHGVQRK
ncbi:hypothetical protein GUITHDRAFT_155260 [Guillardia theta CCMP2712]|uniref:Uncharacterized protein n=1 Tax=Guillardia theta (strain CCMP2712) TaxID=905079 RepID=L1IKN2_GUITC|nr:hypothetical protein GUITHDRAFT_155260 [Guillardia theta CCMP2712]EKX36350.1 hypothetical protein GUITHDRAFT_155260 [Guillardia theta CCMP2712]|eukprot:XP_005823330.1 hypothetical protein GUITHDRAFT_155260 [Guillardia theta CCMP2712]